MDPETEPRIRVRPLLPLRAFAPLRSPALAALLSLCAFLPGFTWGLPSRDADPFLFGELTPWTGAEIVALLGEFNPAGAADVDQTGGGGVVNDTDRERAEIVARYRLYSYQPDEMLTFRALAAAAGNRGDPRFYTYGGLWVYPVGGLIVLGQQLGLIGVGGQAYYLDNPDEFAKFYLVARGYAAAWAAIGAAIVCVLVRRVTRSDVLGVAAALTYALLPVVVVGAHEAKPHLPGAVLATWAVLPAERHVRTGRGLLWAGVLCGLATGMVVTMAVSFLVLPTAWWLRRRRAARRRAVAADLRPRVGYQPVPDARTEVRGYPFPASVALGVLAFAVTNPYLVVNALIDPSALAGNAANTAGHYDAPDGSSLKYGLRLYLIATAGFAPLLLILLGGATLLISRRLRRVGLLCGLPGGAIFAAFVLTAGGRPFDHARFALLAATLTPPVALVALSEATRFLRRGSGEGSIFARFYPVVEMWIVIVLVAGTTIYFGSRNTLAFVADRDEPDTRSEAAEILAGIGGGDLTLWADPAPAFVPPFDLWRWRARVVGEGAEVTMPPGETPISWADRPVVIDLER